MEPSSSGMFSEPQYRVNSTTESRHDGALEVTGENGSKSGNAIAMDNMGNSTSKVDSNRRRRLFKRRFTMLPNARAEPRPFVNKYFFKRPRLLQYYEGGDFVDAQGHRIGPTNPDDVFMSNTSSEGGTLSSVQSHLVEDNTDPATSKVQRDWLNLFIDLLWVGIVSNISANFVETAFEPGSSWGLPFLEFIVLFLTAYRLWSYLRKFLNNFFRKDFIQSVFLTWTLVVALFFGNQTRYFLDNSGRRWVIATFLVGKGSFIALESFYCIFIPSIRREYLMTVLISVPVTVLWICSFLVSWPTQAALILPAVLMEGIVSAIISLPIGDWFLHGAPRKALDPGNLVDRLQGFFIIVLGEGVFGLISENDWGVGLTDQVSWAIQALIIYYALFWLFFTGDQTKTYIHAIYHNRYTSLMFQLCHILLYASILLLDASIKYLISNSLISEDGYRTPPVGSDIARSLLLARWTIAGSLAGTLVWLTLKAFLNRSLDDHGTLRVNNRYLRMAPRGLVIIIIMCLPAVGNMDPWTFLGVIMAMLQALILWEVVAAMDKDAKWFEPKDAPVDR